MQRILNIFLMYLTVFILLANCADTVQAAAGVMNIHAQRLQTRDTQTYNFEFRNESMDRVLFIISERTGAEFIYEPQVTDGIRVNAVFRDEELRTILNGLLSPAGLETRRIRTGVFVVRYSMRKMMAGRLLPSEGTDRLARQQLAGMYVASSSTDLTIPVREIIRQIVLP